ncbi:MAG TPA: hypothetical protein VGN14_05465 [Candidatus Elarobacter sp.]|jgi:hypothetical protein
MEIPTSFFTAQSAFTLTGAAAITIVVANGVYYASGKNPRWLALAVAIVICVVGTYASGQGHGPIDYLVAVLNGFLVFATARGGAFTLATATTKPEQKAAEGGPQAYAPSTSGPTRRRFFSAW